MEEFREKTIGASTEHWGVCMVPNSMHDLPYEKPF